MRPYFPKGTDLALCLAVIETSMSARIVALIVRCAYAVAEDGSYRFSAVIVVNRIGVFSTGCGNRPIRSRIKSRARRA